MPPLPCNVKKVVALLKQWVKDSIVQLPLANLVPTPTEEQDPNFCIYLRKKSYALDQCFVFRKTFDKTLHDGKLILQKEGARDVHEWPFPNHNNKGKRQAMMVSVLVDAPEVAEGEANLDKMA